MPHTSPQEPVQPDQLPFAAPCHRLPLLASLNWSRLGGQDFLTSPGLNIVNGSILAAISNALAIASRFLDWAALLLSLFLDWFLSRQYWRLAYIQSVVSLPLVVAMLGYASWPGYRQTIDADMWQEHAKLSDAHPVDQLAQ